MAVTVHEIPVFLNCSFVAERKTHHSLALDKWYNPSLAVWCYKSPLIFWLEDGCQCTRHQTRAQKKLGFEVLISYVI